MKKSVKVTLFMMIAAYICSGIGTLYISHVFAWPFLLLPIPLLLVIGIVGGNLKGNGNNVLRIAAVKLLLACLAVGFYMVMYSGEQGGIGIIFIGLPAMAAILCLYCFLLLIQFLQRRLGSETTNPIDQTNCAKNQTQ